MHHGIWNVFAVGVLCICTLHQAPRWIEVDILHDIEVDILHGVNAVEKVGTSILLAGCIEQWQ